MSAAEVGRAAVATVQNIPNAVDFPPFTIPAEWHPAEAPRAAILLLPALGTPLRYYRPFAQACAACGFQVLLPELPGTGESLPRPSRRADYGYRELLGHYLPALVGQARSRAPGLPLVVVGHSLGAHAGMLSVLHRKIVIEALVTVAGGDIHYRNWVGKGAGVVRLLAGVVAALSRALGQVPGQYLGLGGPQARTLMRQWSRIIRTGGYSHIAGPLPEAPRLPVLCIGYEGDFMAPSRSVAGLAHLLGGEMEWLAVDWPGNPHASWARHPDPTLQRIDAWLVSRGVVPPVRGAR